MNVLLDSCIWGPAAHEVAAAGHDVEWVGDWPEDPGDDGILAAALGQQRVLVTLDKDFGELAVVYGRPHCGILRLVGFRAREQGPACVRVLAQYGSELQAGAVITASRGRLRIRPADHQ